MFIDRTHFLMGLTLKFSWEDWDLQCPSTQVLVLQDMLMLSWPFLAILKRGNFIVGKRIFGKVPKPESMMSGSRTLFEIALFF